MASIYGISLKAVKMFHGHEGEPCYQGNLYLNNKKIGFWSQDSHGGPDHLRLDVPYSEQLLNKAVINRSVLKSAEKSKLYGFDVTYDLDHLCWDLLDLMDDEKEFKLAMKAGHGCLVVLHTAVDTYYWYTKSNWGIRTDKDILDAFEPSFQDILKDLPAWQKNDTKHIRKCVYRKPSDFIFGANLPIAPYEITSPTEG